MELIQFITLIIFGVILYIIYLFCLGFVQGWKQSRIKFKENVVESYIAQEFIVKSESSECLGTYMGKPIHRYIILDNGEFFEYESVAIWNKVHQAYHSLTKNKYVVRNNLLYKQCSEPYG